MATQPLTPIPGTIPLKPLDPQPKAGEPGGPKPPQRPPLQPLPPTPSTNTAAPDPGMQDVNKMTRDYIAGIPEAVGHTTDVAGSKIRDSYEGVYKANAGRASSRGVMGTGVHGVMDSGTDDEQLRALAGSATDIAVEGRKTAGQMLTQLAQQEASRAGLQQNQQQIGLQQRAADLAAQRQMQEQLDALDVRYREKQPRSYYDDTDPESVTPGGQPGGGKRLGESDQQYRDRLANSGGGGNFGTGGTPSPSPMRTRTYSDLGDHPFAGVR